ncbi:FadR/GntR family transcriptional regulator [Corynebacterium glutamicum]|uniref:HTH gntR-type domain-containing protein n=1 Tax=Corynebacterium glutamicum (strain R) TaxID=340322 RepID=A0AB72VEC9_CORGB|nr:FadR/GntR family transcriptional regulator [Corynebacterium glutamicum]BAF55826.1 hypothetical protein cgR_2807 [Corynebacterium glutamicum R]
MMFTMNLSDSWTPRQPVLSRTSAAEEVFNAIRQGIESGEIPLGSKLSSEAALAASFGVSRSVIREALRSSATLGLTKTETGRGTFVISASPTNDLVLGNFSSTDLYEARPHIEVPAAGLAATRRSKDDLQQLFNIIEQMEAEDDHVAWVELDTEFHAAIANASGNSVFAKIVGDIRESLARQSETVNVVSGRREPSDAEHRAIVEAIAAQDKDAAEAAMAFHLSAVQVAVDDIVSKQS